MTLWWNLPFALFLLLALWCRVQPDSRLNDSVVGLLGFFGVGPSAAGRGATDLFAIAGSAGLVFVGWADDLAAPDGWILADAVFSALGLGLVGAWALARLGQRWAEPAGGPSPRQMEMMTMMEVEELPSNSARSRSPGPGSPL